MMQTKVLIMAGGTGGHVLPALAVAQALQKANIQVHWLGTQAGLEHQLVSAHFPLHYISANAVRGKDLKTKLLAPWRLLMATAQAFYKMIQLKPQVVIGFGGFVSAPGGIAAVLLRKPFVICEQNAIAGMTNRYLARFSTQIFQAFPHTFPEHLKPLTIGNPIRVDILNLPAPEQRMTEPGALRLLILGGSQGAGVFNQIVPEALARIPHTQRPQIWHIAGKNRAKETQQIYQHHGISARVDEFVQDMAAAYAWADLVFCRAGALTIFELAAAGVASILVPYPYAVDDHQTRNAQYLVGANAAILLPQPMFSAKSVANLLIELNRDRARLLAMAKAAYTLRKPEATQAVLEKVTAAMI